MTCWLKQSTAVEIGMGPFVDSADGNTVEGSLTITQPDIRLKKNGGAWAQKNASQTLSHEENGWYEVALDSTDTNTLGILIVAIHESGALPVWREFMVVSAMVYDSLIGGGDTLDVQVTGMGADTITASAIATGAIDADAIAANAIGSSEIADGAITAAKIATDAIDADALAADAIAEINATVDTALSDYDGPTNAELATALAAADDAVLSAIGGLNDLSAADVWGLTIEDSHSASDLMRGLAAVAFANAVGLGGPTASIRDLADTKDRVIADVDGSSRDVTALDLT